MRLARRLILSVAIVALAACGSKSTTTTTVVDETVGPNTGVAALRTNGVITQQNDAGAKPVVAYGNGKTIGAVKALPPASGDITLDFQDADIREVVAAILGKILNVPYTIDPAVQGTTTIKTAQPIARSGVLPMLENVLAQSNMALVVSNGLYQVMPINNTATRPIAGDLGAQGGGEMVQLQYASAQALVKVIQPFVARGGKISADSGRNVIIVAGDPLTRETLVDLIKSFDVDILAGQSYALFPVTSGTPSKVASELEKMLLTEPDHALSGQVQVIAMPRINAVFVASAQSRYIDDARRLLQLVDRASTNSEPAWHIYYVQNGQSTDLENLLQRAFTPRQVTSTGGTDTNRLANTAPGFASTSTSSQVGTGQGQGQGQGFGQGAAQAQGMPLAGLRPDSGGVQGAAGTSANGDDQQGRTQTPATQSLSATGDEGDEMEARIRIIANRKNNALLIYAPPDQYAIIEAMLQKIDIVPLQVRIDATIAEVTLNDQLQYGTQFFFKNGGLSGTLSNATTSTVAGTFPGFVLNKLSGGAEIALSALQQVTNLQVLSSPQVTVLDNELALIQVGDNVPYVTGTSTSTLTTTATVQSTVNYQQTGVVLQVIPRVNSSGLVALDISQDVSLPVTTTSSGIDSPTFQDRKIQSRVVVQDSQTLGIAGMIQDSRSEGNGGIPFLKDIPILGSVFSTQNNQRKRTELLVLLTPHVIYDQRGARMLTDDLRSQLLKASQVPGMLQSMKITGSANPNGRLSP